MIIGERLRALRQTKQMSQGDIETRTGLKRCYVSRVENGHTVPSVDTLEKFALALEIPMYVLFYDGAEPPRAPSLPATGNEEADSWGRAGKNALTLRQFRRAFGQISSSQRQLLLQMASKMSKK
jgi:transcriptional regulator with XRE-family HTH domain